MIWRGNKRIIELKETILEFEGFEQRFFDHCNVLEQEVEEFILKYGFKSKIKKKDYNQFIFDYEQIIYKSNGFSLHVLELLKSSKHFIDGFKNQYDEHVALNVDEFKYSRRNFKKRNKNRIRKIFKSYSQYQANRNLIAHNCIAELNLYVILNQEEIASVLRECKNMLSEIYGSINELEKLKYKQERKNNTLINIKDLFNEEELRGNKFIY
ncbi:hypothetical protein ACLM5H_08645 [Fredinandcohnia humi]